MKLIDWIVITIVIIILAFLLKVMIEYKNTAVQIQEMMLHGTERIDAEGTVSESVKNDTLEPWCEMYYYGENGVRIKCGARNIDTIVKKSFNVDVDNMQKEIHFWKQETISF